MILKFKLICLALICFTIHSQAQEQETIMIEWPKQYNWEVLSNNESDQMHRMEIVPKNETGENWTILGQMMSIKGAHNISMEKAKELMYKQIKMNAPGAIISTLQKDEDLQLPWILFKIECPKFEDNNNPESQLWYIKQGLNALYINFVAIKKASLDDVFIDRWGQVFIGSKLVKL